jgi:DNA-directed RNA polymerase beta' subunit
MDKDRPTHQIESVRFDMYDAETIKRISACTITESVAYDNLNTPIKHGVHDPSLGISAYDRQNSNCNLCGLDNENCPGHFGHIELAVPVYNPFTLKYIHRLLNSKCFNCHYLKMRNKDKAYIFLKFVLLKMGLIQEANMLDGIVYTAEAHSEVERRINQFIERVTGKTQSFAEEENNIHGRLGSIDTTNTDDTGNTGNTRTTDKKKKKIVEKNEELQNLEEHMKESMRTTNKNLIESIFKKVEEKVQKDPNNIQDQNLNVQYELK